MTAAEQIADFALSLSQDDLPEPVVRAAGLHLADAIGVGLASATGAGQSGWSQVVSGQGPCVVFSGMVPTGAPFGMPSGVSSGAPGAALPLRASPAEAAMLNGALIHALEFDDTHIGSVIHGSAVAAPVALAVAEAEGASGADLFCAYVIAWEVMIRIGLSAPGAFQARGTQVTAIAGAIGAAAAAGRLMGLSRQQLTSAIGIAGSQASGLLAFLEDGSSAKALNPGWAAHTGILAAGLARGGMTGPGTILESPFGVMQTFAGGAGTLDAQLGDLGQVWHLPDAAFKLYACCHYIHPFLEALENLMSDGLKGADIKQIVAHVAVEQAPLICEPWARRQAPASGYDGKWGLAYCMGLMLVDGRVDVAAFETAPRAEVIAMAQRIAWEPVASSGFPSVFPARLDVVMQDGRRISEDIATVRGGQGPDGATREIAPQEVWAKFHRNAGRRLTTDQSAALRAILSDLHRASDVTALMDALSADLASALSADLSPAQSDLSAQ